MLSTISSFIWGDDLKLSENKKMLPGTKNDKFEEVKKKQEVRDNSPQCDDWVVITNEVHTSEEFKVKETLTSVKDVHHQSRQSEILKSVDQKGFYVAQVNKQRCTNKVINRKALKRSDMVLRNKSRSKPLLKSVGLNKNLKQC